MQLIKFSAAAAALLLLTGCGRNSSENAASTAPAGSDTEPLLTSLSYQTTADTTAATTHSVQQSSLATEQSTSESSVSRTTTSVLHTVSTASSVSLAQGGEGGEDHASDPDPEFFTYRFFPESVSMRLAGGNYQTIFYDFKAALEHDVNALFHLDDVNFDQHPDLFVPVEFDSQNITSAVFLWNPDTMYFQSEPILLCNPQLDPDSETVSSLVYENEARPETVLRYFRWVDGKLSEIRALIADYTAFTLTDVPAEGSETIRQFENADQLHEAFVLEYQAEQSAAETTDEAA